MGTIDLGGKPEFAAADGAGNVFANLEDKDAVVKIDAKQDDRVGALAVGARRGAVGDGDGPKNHRIFVGCHNKMMVVVNAETGKVVDHQPIGERVDAAAFDPETGMVFFSCGDGTVTVIHEDEPDKYSVAETVKTKPRSADDGAWTARRTTCSCRRRTSSRPRNRRPDNPQAAAVDGAGDFRGPALRESDRPWSPSGPEA